MAATTINPEALNRRVANLIDDANESIKQSCVPHLITSRKKMIELRRDIWSQRDEPAVRNHRAHLYQQIGRVNHKLDQINKSRVTTEILKAGTTVKEAQLQITNPHPTIEACYLAASVVQLAKNAIAILNNLQLNYYLRQHLKEHQETIASTRRTAEELTNHQNILRIITQKQEALRHITQRLAAEILHEQQLRLAQEATKATLLFKQFSAAVDRQSLELAERLYHTFATYGPEVHAIVSKPQDPAMQLRRMSDKVRGLKEEWFGRKVRQI